MQRADFILSLFALGLMLTFATLMDAGVRGRVDANSGVEARQLVRSLELTDLALFTEARYTRHPSQADLHSAFQDHPMALEHFPSGSLVPAPRLGKGAP